MGCKQLLYGCRKLLRFVRHTIAFITRSYLQHVCASPYMALCMSSCILQRCCSRCGGSWSNTSVSSLCMSCDNHIVRRRERGDAIKHGVIFSNGDVSKSSAGLHLSESFFNVHNPVHMGSSLIYLSTSTPPTSTVAVTC